MRFAIQVSGHPASSQAADTAYQFIKAAMALNHEVIGVFFYRDGVMTAFADPRWSTLAAEGVALRVCVAATERRGLPPLPDGFGVGGLGQWVDACLRADRFIDFAS